MLKLLLGPIDIKIMYDLPATGSDPRRPEAREHNVGGAGAAALPRQGHRLRQRQPRQQGRLQHLPTEQILQVFFVLHSSLSYNHVRYGHIQERTVKYHNLESDE